MIQDNICYHYWPLLPMACDIGLHAPRDCDGCPAYNDGTKYLENDDVSAERVRLWPGSINETGVSS